MSGLHGPAVRFVIPVRNVQPFHLFSVTVPCSLEEVTNVLGCFCHVADNYFVNIAPQFSSFSLIWLFGNLAAFPSTCPNCLWIFIYIRPYLFFLVVFLFFFLVSFIVMLLQSCFFLAFKTFHLYFLIVHVPVSFFLCRSVCLYALPRFSEYFILKIP
jgi:hypothetical protein